MSITYNLASDDPAVRALSRVRKHLADTTLNAGPKPEGANVSDAEIADFLSESGGGVYGAAALAADAIAAAWASNVATQAGPLRREWNQAAAAWSQRATALRKQAAAAGEQQTGLPALQAGVVLSGQTEILS